MIRPRPAPSATRMPTSRVRREERARSRLATLAQAIRRTNPTAPISARKTVRILPPLKRSLNVISPTPRSLLVSGYCCWRRAAIADSSVCACSCVAPGAQPAEHAEAAVVALRGLRGVGDVGPPQVGVGRKAHAFRHDADDLGGAVVDFDRASQDRRIAAIAVLPDRVAQDHDRRGARAGPHPARSRGPGAAPGGAAGRCWR